MHNNWYCCVVRSITSWCCPVVWATQDITKNSCTMHAFLIDSYISTYQVLIVGFGVANKLHSMIITLTCLFTCTSSSIRTEKNYCFVSTPIVTTSSYISVEPFVNWIIIEVSTLYITTNFVSLMMHVWAFTKFQYSGLLLWSLNKKCTKWLADNCSVWYGLKWIDV